jgi:hypothetical protein
MVERTESAYFGVLAGHILQGGGMVPGATRQGSAGRAVCECGAASEVLRTRAARLAWHREHKGAVVAEISARLKAENKETEE